MSPTRPHMHHGVTRGLGGKNSTGVKCNPHGIDIQFFCDFFAACTDYRLGYLDISTIFSPNDVDRRLLHS